MGLSKKNLQPQDGMVQCLVHQMCLKKKFNKFITITKKVPRSLLLIFGKKLKRKSKTNE